MCDLGELPSLQMRHRPLRVRNVRSCVGFHRPTARNGLYTTEIDLLLLYIELSQYQSIDEGRNQFILDCLHCRKQEIPEIRESNQ